MDRVTILMGIPGSGKTTWAKAQEAAPIKAALIKAALIIGP